MSPPWTAILANALDLLNRTAVSIESSKDSGDYLSYTSMTILLILCVGLVYSY